MPVARADARIAERNVPGNRAQPLSRRSVIFTFEEYFENVHCLLLRERRRPTSTSDYRRAKFRNQRGLRRARPEWRSLRRARPDGAKGEAAPKSRRGAAVCGPE